MMDVTRAILVWVARADLALCRLSALPWRLLPLALISAGGSLLVLRPGKRRALRAGGLRGNARRRSIGRDKT